MFENKDREENYSSDELELMKMIKEYEQDEAEEKHTQAFQEEAHQEVLHEHRVPTYQKESALDSGLDHTRVMSRQSMEEDKTLTIMPVSSRIDETQAEQTMNIPKQVEPVEEEDEDPRFELKRKKDKGKKPKKDKKKKDKNPDKEDERLNKTILILLIIAGIVVTIAGGYLIYNSFFRDKTSDDKTEQVTPKKDKDTTSDKKPTTDNTETTEPKDDHAAEIKALQALIDQETNNMNNYTKLADDAQTALNTYNATKESYQAKVTAAQAVVDQAGDQATEEQKKAVTDAQAELDKFLKDHSMPSQSTIDENRTKASECFGKIENYRNQIAAFQQ